MGWKNVALNVGFLSMFICFGLACFTLGEKWSKMNQEECEVMEFIKIAEVFAEEHEGMYDIDNYNCVNYSRDLVDVYEKAGFSAEVVSGWRSAGEYCKVADSIEGVPLSSINESDCGGAHAWVEVNVPIEAITGVVVK